MDVSINRVRSEATWGAEALPVAPEGSQSFWDLRLAQEVAQIQPLFRGLTLCLSQAWGGLEKVAVQDALTLASLGLKTFFLCLEGSAVHRALLESRQQVPSLEVVALERVPQNLLDWRLRRVLLDLIGSGVNLIHSHQTTLLGSLVPWLWGARRSIPLVLTRHILNAHNKKDWIHRALYQRVDYLTVVSHAIRQNMLDTHPIASGRVRVVHLGLDFEVFSVDRFSAQEISDQRAAWGVDSQTVAVGLVGRIDPAKGQATLIQAAAGLKRGRSSLAQGREKLKFILVGEETVGSDPAYRQELEQMISQFNLDAEVVFTGYQKEIARVMRALDLFVMPSRQEAFGLVAIEAMAMECPVILSRGGSAEEIVGLSGERGLYTRPEDAFDLQTQIRFLLEHPRERVEMGRRGRAWVLEHFDWRKRVVETLQLYQRAYRRRQGRLGPEEAPPGVTK
jgi:glycosyltransferase involved in cell wall biosynthesis